MEEVEDTFGEQKRVLGGTLYKISLKDNLFVFRAIFLSLQVILGSLLFTLTNYEVRQASIYVDKNISQY